MFREWDTTLNSSIPLFNGIVHTYASKAFLGYYLPLFKSKTSKDIGVEGRVMGSITLGLLSLNRERDGNDDCSGKGCEEFHFVGDPCVVV